MIARREFFPRTLSRQAPLAPPTWEPEQSNRAGVRKTWREELSNPQTQVILALGLGMVLGWIIKRR